MQILLRGCCSETLLFIMLPAPDSLQTMGAVVAATAADAEVVMPEEEAEDTERFCTSFQTATTWSTA